VKIAPDGARAHSIGCRGRTDNAGKGGDAADERHEQGERGGAAEHAGRSELMSTAPAPVELERPDAEEDVRADRPWLAIVWNDPINLMSYVTYVFQTVFGYPKSKAEKLMLDVHHKGRAVVAKGTREEMERDVEILHSYGLWATVKRDD
jgi:ATP-dependent Clp protease adaptor protein ClpS